MRDIRPIPGVLIAAYTPGISIDGNYATSKPCFIFLTRCVQLGPLVFPYCMCQSCAPGRTTWQRILGLGVDQTLCESPCGDESSYGESSSGGESPDKLHECTRLPTFCLGSGVVEAEDILLVVVVQVWHMLA